MNPLILIIIAIVVAYIARSKGRNFVKWLILGFFLNIFALIYILFAKESKPKERKSKEVKNITSQIANTPLNKTIQNDIRIVNDCVTLMNTSNNIKTVIGRYNDLLAVLTRLSKYENNPAVSFHKDLPSATLARIHAEKSKIMTAAVQRAYDDMMKKCAALKTENSRKKRQLKFFDLLMSHAKDFPSKTNDFVQKLINKNINEPVAKSHARP